MVATYLDDVHALHFVLLYSHNTSKCLERSHNVRSEFRVILFLLSAEEEEEGEEVEVGEE